MRKKDLKYFGFIFWSHLLLILIAYSSPFLFNWKIIVFGSLILIIQYYIFGGCVLNKVQFDDANEVFLYPYITMIGLRISRYFFRIFIRYILPLILISLAVIWQVILGIKPLIF